MKQAREGYIPALVFFNILPDIKIDIDEDMQSMMIVLNDETIIKSLDYYIPAEIRKQYKG